MCFVRKALDFLFTQDELFWLDDILPDSPCSRNRSAAIANQTAQQDMSSKVTLVRLSILSNSYVYKKGQMHVTGCKNRLQDHNPSEGLSKWGYPDLENSPRQS